MTATPVRPQVNDDVLRALSQAEGVCVRPLLNRVTDTATGDVRVMPIRCGSTRAVVCRPCADRNRRLRMQQCREGWYLDTEPESAPEQPVRDVLAKPDGDDTDHNDLGRRVRSTRRRQDVPDLPSVPVEARTIGRVFEAPDGRRFRPSMFATFTLPSYGRVRADGTPVDPGRYDYRRQALDAMHFPKLVDRLWQNLRRTTGYRVQYFAAVEPQRRLAPHLHAAIRGAVPRRVFRQVVAATYHQVWWPAFDQPVFTDQVPVWSGDAEGYVDPATGMPLPTWCDALDALDEGLDADPSQQPAHVVRFGPQLDLQGIIASSTDADRRVGYLTKYLTKAVADTYGDSDQVAPARAAHLARLYEEVRWLPCTPRCWNWLRYGIQPAHASEGMEPGQCPGRAHRSENLGCGGRRVLVSRLWTGKTLTDHQADRATVVREALAAAGIAMPDADTYSATATDPPGDPGSCGRRSTRPARTRPCFGKRFSWPCSNVDDGGPITRPRRPSWPTGEVFRQPAHQTWEVRPPDRHESTSLLRPPRITSRTWVAGLRVKGERGESRSDICALDRQNSDHTINHPGRTKPREEQRSRAMDEVSTIEDRLWSVDEVSYYLGVPVNTLYMWRSEGRGPASRRVGRHLRYRAEDVKAWVQGLDGWAVA